MNNIEMKTLDVLRNNESKRASNWREDAENRRKNKSWLRYSQYIALVTRNRMAELGITQSALAELLGCTQQHVSLMLKGTSNLTLETIAKLETALDFSIIGDCLTFVDGYKDMGSISRNRQYLTEADSPSYGE